jgi:hypothetical protein
LQEQFHDRVLAPVAKEINPAVVREQATKRYVQILSTQLQRIPHRYGVPSDQFDRRTKDISAIAQAPHPGRNASLYQIVHADSIATLPAYVELIAQIQKDAGDAGVGPLDASISPVAKRAAEKLGAQLAARGGASVAAAALGGVAGVIISLGATGYGVITHENERPKMEMQLRETLNPVMDEMWVSLMEDPATGVMAGVNHISQQIEGSLAKTLTQPITFEPLPRGIPLQSEEALKDEKGDDKALSNDGYADE